MAGEYKDFWRDVLPSETREALINALPPMISVSGEMKSVARKIISAAQTGSTVLLEGASGTGKDLFARAVHLLSPRTGKLFVALNCAAVTESLFESELFGHERGAFTGAETQTKGMWQEAHEGTLFLDEIGDMPLAVQAKVLRAIENRKIRRVGGTRELDVDVRIVAATNMDLAQMVKEGRFRNDLYYRVNVVAIAIPPLHRRSEDIPLLFDHFLRALSERMKRPVPAVSSDTMEGLKAHTWPGNVRELQNVVERALATTMGRDELTQDDFSTASGHEKRETLYEMVSQLEADVIRRTLIETRGNQTWAADRLGLGRTVLITKIRQYGLRGLYPELFGRRSPIVIADDDQRS